MKFTLALAATAAIANAVSLKSMDGPPSLADPTLKTKEGMPPAIPVEEVKGGDETQFPPGMPSLKEALVGDKDPEVAPPVIPEAPKEEEKKTAEPIAPIVPEEKKTAEPIAPIEPEEKKTAEPIAPVEPEEKKTAEPIAPVAPEEKKTAEPTPVAAPEE
jgi:hypothetical protein